MALLFADSFDHYATADILQKWSSITGFSSPTIGAYGQNSTKGLRIANITSCADRSLTPGNATMIFGAAVKPTMTPVSNQVLASVFDGTSKQFGIRVNADMTLSLVRGVAEYGGGTLLGTTSGSLILDNFTYVEWKVVIGNSGSYEIRFNGMTVLSGTGDTQETGSAAWSMLRLGSVSGSGNITADYDDLYVADGTGSRNNDFLGPIRVKVIFPDGAGTYSQMSRGGVDSGANWSQVDETSQNGDTDYVGETTAGEKDTYTYEAVGLTGTVKAVQTNLIVRSDGAGSETIAPLWRISSTDHAGTTVGISTSYTDSRQVYEISPDSGVAWTVSEIDGAEFGPKLVS